MANDYNINGILSITNKFTQPLQQFRQQMENVRNIMNRTQQQGSKTFTDTVNGIQVTITRTGNLRADITKLANEYKKAGLSATDAMKKAHASLKKVNDETKKTTENVGQMSNSMTNMASKVKTALATIGVSKVGKDIVETYATFEQSMSKVQALSGASGQDLQALTDKAKEMGEKTSKSASESADALGYMALAGWDTNQMLTGLEPMLRASEAGGMDLARCSDLVTDSMSAMGIQVGDLNHYLDVCSKAQASSNTSLAQITEAYIGCGGTLKNMNVSVEESATLLGVLANRGKKGSEAGNALNSVLVNLMGTGGQASKALESLGVSMYNEDGTNKGITNTLRELNVALGNCTQKQKDQFEAMIGGKTQMDTLQALLSGVNEEYDDLNAKLNDSEGYLNECAKTMQDNLLGQWTQFKSAVEGVKIAIGERLAPALSEFMDYILTAMPNIKQSITDWLDWMIQKAIPQLIPKLKALIPIVTGLVAGFTALKVINTVTRAINGVKTAIAFLTSPIGIVVLAIAGLVAGFIYAYKHSEQFREKVQNLAEKIIYIKDRIGQLIDKFKENEKVMEALKQIYEFCCDVMKTVVVETFNEIADKIGFVIDVVNSTIETLHAISNGDWKSVWESFKKNALSSLVEIFDNIVKLGQFATNPVGAIVTTVSGKFGEKIGHNAKGTDNWRGGLTWVNEEGGELMNLPNGTQIIPHDLSETMVKEKAQNDNNTGIVIPKLADQIIIREDADIDKIGQAIANKVALARLRLS